MAPTAEQALKNAGRTTSYGHLGFFGDWEYYQLPNGQVYRSLRIHPMDAWGYRQGPRWVCFARDWAREETRVRARLGEALSC